MNMCLKIIRVKFRSFWKEAEITLKIRKTCKANIKNEWKFFKLKGKQTNFKIKKNANKKKRKASQSIKN